MAEGVLIKAGEGIAFSPTAGVYVADSACAVRPPCCGPPPPPVADCSTGEFCAAFPGSPYVAAPVGVWPDPAVRNCCYGANHRLTVDSFISEWRVDRLASMGVDAGFWATRATLTRATSIVISSPNCDPKFWPHENGGAEFALEWSGSRPNGGCPGFSYATVAVTRFAMFPNAPMLMPDTNGVRTGRVGGNPGRASWCPVPAFEFAGPGTWAPIAPWSRTIVETLWNTTQPAGNCAPLGFNQPDEAAYAGVRDSGVATFTQGGGASLRSFRVVSTNAWSVACGGAFNYDLLAEVEIRNSVGVLLKTISERVRCTGSVTIL